MALKKSKTDQMPAWSSSRRQLVRPNCTCSVAGHTQQSTDKSNRIAHGLAHAYLWDSNIRIAQRGAGSFTSRYWGW